MVTTHMKRLNLCSVLVKLDRDSVGFEREKQLMDVLAGAAGKLGSTWG